MCGKVMVNVLLRKKLIYPVALIAVWAWAWVVGPPVWAAIMAAVVATTVASAVDLFYTRHLRRAGERET